MMGLDVLLKSPPLWTRWQMIKKKKKKAGKKHKRCFFSFVPFKKKKKTFPSKSLPFVCVLCLRRYILYFLHVALSTRFVKNLMTHTQNSSCGAKVVYSRFWEIWILMRPSPSSSSFPRGRYLFERFSKLYPNPGAAAAACTATMVTAHAYSYTRRRSLRGRSPRHDDGVAV